jgi:2-methylcitrate dehydratase PrpD
VEEVMGLRPDSGPCLIIGTRRRASPLDAALVNGTAAHALDFDNTAKSLGGHASAVIVPALIAAGEDSGAGGRELILAHAAGFEVGAAIGRCVNPEHSEKGWHPTATIGVFAVTAACARLLQLTVEQTATALGLATSLSAGIKANFGTMTKPFHAGQCARGAACARRLYRQSRRIRAQAGLLQRFRGGRTLRCRPCPGRLGRLGDREARRELQALSLLLQHALGGRSDAQPGAA